MECQLSGTAGLQDSHCRKQAAHLPAWPRSSQPLQGASAVLQGRGCVAVHGGCMGQAAAVGGPCGSLLPLLPLCCQARDLPCRQCIPKGSACYRVSTGMTPVLPDPCSSTSHGQQAADLDPGMKVALQKTAVAPPGDSMLLTLPRQRGHRSGQETCRTKIRTSVGKARAPLVRNLFWLSASPEHWTAACTACSAKQGHHPAAHVKQPGNMCLTGAHLPPGQCQQC